MPGRSRLGCLVADAGSAGRSGCSDNARPIPAGCRSPLREAWRLQRNARRQEHIAAAIAAHAIPITPELAAEFALSVEFAAGQSGP